MSLRKVWLIARREFTTNFRRRSFLFATFAVPVFSLFILAIIVFIVAQNLDDLSAFTHIGIVDQASVLTDASGTSRISLPSPFELLTSTDEAKAALDNNTVQGYYVIPQNYVDDGQIEVYSKPEPRLSDALNKRFQDVIQQAVVSQFGDATLAQRLLNPMKNLVIYRVGSPVKLDQIALLAVFLVPFILCMLIFFATTSTSQFMMSGLVEEKENRMMELFITSTRLSEILWGKILGLGALGLAQILIWILITLIFMTLRGGIDLGKSLANLQLTPGYVLLLLAYFFLGYLLYGSIMFGIGASVNAEQESRQLGGLVTIISVLPFIFLATYFSDPNGALPIFLSFFPLTAPIGMILRVSWAYVPPGEIILSLVILAAFAVLVTRLAALVFRLGMLNYGKRLSLRDIFSGLRGGRKNGFVSSPKEVQA
jgi:ABC-2 type transport system permease protein